MNNSTPLILIVVPPGDLQIGLQALLTTRLEVDVLVTGEESSAMKVVERHNPAMVNPGSRPPGERGSYNRPKDQIWLARYLLCCFGE